MNPFVHAFTTPAYLQTAIDHLIQYVVYIAAVLLACTVFLLGVRLFCGNTTIADVREKLEKERRERDRNR